MQQLLKWIRKERYLPYDNYTWTRLLGEAKKRHLVNSGCLRFDDSTVNEIRVKGKDFNVQKVGKSWYGFHDDDEIIFSDKDILKLELDRKTFARHISKLLNIQNPLSELPYGCDGFYLGNLNLGANYRVFFCYSFSKFTKAANELVGDCRPLVILFSDASAELQDFVARKNGECLPFEACIALSEKGFEVFGTLKDMLAVPRKIKSKGGYYIWSATGYPMPNNPSLKLLKIDLVSPVEISITYGGNIARLHYADISIFRNEHTGEFNENWKILTSLALKEKYIGVKGDSLKTYQKRLNANMRDFFDFKESAFSVSDGVINNNFELYASYKYNE